MGNALTVRSIDDLIEMKRGDLQNFLSKTAGILNMLESRIKEIADLKSNLEQRKRKEAYKYGPETGVLYQKSYGYNRRFYFIMSFVMSFLLITIAAMIITILVRYGVDGFEEGIMAGIFIRTAPIALAISIVLAFFVSSICVKILKKGKQVYQSISQEMSELDDSEQMIMDEFEGSFHSTENQLGVIPGKYRMSVIIYKFCEYLEEGKANSWQDCIYAFEHDVHRMKEERRFQETINRLDAIKANTRALTFFAGVIAWNTM